MTSNGSHHDEEPGLPIVLKDGIIESEADVVPTGPVRFSILNAGDQDREVLVGRPEVLTFEPGSGWANRRFQVLATTGPIGPGERGSVEVELTPGIYSLLGIPPPDDISLMEYRLTAQPVDPEPQA